MFQAPVLNVRTSGTVLAATSYRNEKPHSPNLLAVAVLFI